MGPFEKDRHVSAEYRVKEGAASIDLEGDVGDILILLTTTINQIAEKMGISGATLAAKIAANADRLRRIEGEKIITDLGAIQRAKDERDGR